MMHTMERYFTNGGNMDITDALAEAFARVQEIAILAAISAQTGIGMEM